MRRPSLAGVTAIAVTGTSLLATAGAAQATEPATLYVRQQSTACSDTGSGTLAEPFCTVGKAAAVVTAGQTVDVGRGDYPERVTIATSGTPEQPITFLASDVASLRGPDAGFVIDGQHDVVLQDLRVRGGAGAPALDLHAASGITIRGGSYTMANAPTAPAVRLAGVTGSALTQFTISGNNLADGVTTDAATSGVTIDRLNVVSADTSARESAGIRNGGPGNTIVNNLISGFGSAAIAVGPGATGTVVANNDVRGGIGYGIHNRGATGTAITNNSVQGRCQDGIRVDETSTGVSVQNSYLISNGLFGQSYCPSSGPGGAEIGIDGAGDTVVDYNNTYHNASPSGAAYSWNGTRMSLAAFRTVSGQATHDIDTPSSRDREDSANSAAPGYQATDRLGTARADNPAVANTGAGPVPWADRGATEFYGNPFARFNTALDLGTGSVTVDASASTPGYVPITSYVFDFGDGTMVTQDTPVATHRYAALGDYNVSVQVSGSDGRSSTATPQAVSVLRRTGTVGLLALTSLRYAAAASTGSQLLADQPRLGATAQFDLADAGGGQVALLSRAAGRYVSGNGTLIPAGTWASTAERFHLLRNTDGTISLQAAANNRYVTAASATAALVADATSIGAPQRFYRVNIADSGRSFKSRANLRYVRSDGANAKPLIASSTSVGLWERFDLVDLGNGQIALLAQSNNRFVTAPSAGTLPLIANRTGVGTPERFTLVRNSYGTVSLRAAVNNRYVTAPSAGAKPLIASSIRIGMGSWQRFSLG
ncbi:PKD domain-containing protein [Micromonospora sp. NPDC048930]|uniref:PKD domain-containing protein n=1 Tax=Micromonospora sp. NPDC048930 TaxID=3364261 RepID=UPI0037140ED8